MTKITALKQKISRGWGNWGRAAGLILQFALLSFLVVTIFTGCRVLHRQAIIGTAGKPPVIYFPENPTLDQREAASELADMLKLAFDFEVIPEKLINREKKERRNEKRFRFMVGFLPPKEEQAESSDDNYFYKIKRDTVYFYGGKTDSDGRNVSQENSSAGSYPAHPGLTLAVYSFLENEMGYRWLMPGRRGFYYPDSPVVLSSGKRERVEPVYLPYHRFPKEEKDLIENPFIPEELRLSARNRNRLNELRQDWLLHFGFLPAEEEYKEKKTSPDSAVSYRDDRDVFFFPGDETRLLRTEKEKLAGRIASDLFDFWNWGSADFGFYGVLITIRDRDTMFDQVMADYTAGMKSSAEPVKKYFQYWADIFNQDKKTRQKRIWSVFSEYYQPEKLRERGDFLLKALENDELSESAKFRIELLLVGHEHLRITANAHEKLLNAESNRSLMQALAQIKRLREWRERFLEIVLFDIAGLIARELEHGDLAGIHFYNLVEDLKPVGRFSSWQRQDKNELTSYVAELKIQERKEIKQSARIVIWGLAQDTKVFFNDTELKIYEGGNPAQAGSGKFEIPEEAFKNQEKQELRLRLKEEAPDFPPPCGASWLMTATENESGDSI